VVFRKRTKDRQAHHRQSTVERGQLIALGTAVRTFREQGALDVGTLAVGAGVEPEAIVALEEGRLDPPLDLLLSLAETMGLRASAFIIRAEELGRSDAS
jgi:DNA-binding XRE family transcriptional regulator